MKRIFLIVVSLITLSSMSFASKPNVNKAKSLAFSIESPNIEGAKAIIEEAIASTETNTQAKTWYVAAEVYLQAALIATGENVDVVIGQNAMKAYEYLLKAYELDQMPNAKGKIKPKFTNKIVNQFVNTIYKRNYLISYGVAENNTQNYEDALVAFKKHTEILDLPMVKDSKNVPEKDTTFYDIRYYTAQCAWSAGKNDEAISIYETLKGMNIRQNEIYQSLSILYKEKKDSNAYVKILEEGIVKFPKEFYYLGNLINYYAVETGRPLYAKQYVEQAIANDPNNAQYYVVLASILEMDSKIDEAIVNMDKAISLDPINHEAWNGKGRLIYNKAVALDGKAGAERDIKKSDAIMEEARVIYKESIPFFEKAVELKPDNYEYLKNLRSLYYRFMNDEKEFEDKYRAIDKVIKEL